jgi:hypothetical protein
VFGPDGPIRIFGFHSRTAERREKNRHAGDPTDQRREQLLYRRLPDRYGSGLKSSAAWLSFAENGGQKAVASAYI